VLPKLIEELILADISEAAKIGGWLTFAYAITQFLFAPLIGNLSDKYGRRTRDPDFAIGLWARLPVAVCGAQHWMAFCRAHHCRDYRASITTASAYIAVSTNENRAKNFGMIGAAFGLGFIIWGRVIGGLLGSFGSRVPFMRLRFCACSILFMAILFCPNRWIASTDGN
jgi:DHA1 family tetracycline resistance protein-like MFS transporter